MAELKRVELDEIELCLELLKADNPDEVDRMTCEEIASMIQANFDVVCTRHDVFLLHESRVFNEPPVEQDCLAMEIYYKSIGLY